MLKVVGHNLSRACNNVQGHPYDMLKFLNFNHMHHGFSPFRWEGAWGTSSAVAARLHEKSRPSNEGFSVATVVSNTTGYWDA